VELLLLWAVIDALSLMIVKPPVEDVVKPLLLVVVGVNEEIMLMVIINRGPLTIVVLLATKIVPSTMYPEASTQLPGAMFALPEVKHTWPTAHDQAWFMPRIKPSALASAPQAVDDRAVVGAVAVPEI
jgi:hypothetical protein